MSAGTRTVDDLERWTHSGGHWRVVEISDQHAVVDLCACTGEAMQRVQSFDPAVVEYLRAARSQEALD